MAEYKNILIAFDGSSQSAKALKTAESLAKHYDAQLTVAFVYDDSKERSVGYGTAVAPNTGATTVEPGIGPGSVTTPALSNPDSIESEEPDRVIASAKNKLSHDVDANFEILIGKAADTLITYSHNHDVDLIIMGHRGISGVKKLVMGSVSDKVSNKCECSIFVVK